MHLRDAFVLAALSVTPLLTQAGCSKTTPHGFASAAPGNAALQSIPQHPHVALCPQSGEARLCPLLRARARPTPRARS